MIKLLKILSGIIVALMIILSSALYWPMPDIFAPGKPGKLFIQSVNIVDVETGQILHNRYILIENNRISSIDSIMIEAPDPDTKVIDGEGKYLIPGMWDMHTHSTPLSPWIHHPLYIANGVTGVRDMSGQLGRSDSYWAGTKDRQEWNESMTQHERLSPRYVLQSSYQTNGESSVPDGFPAYFKMNDPSDADSLLAYYAQEGSDFIKVYAELNADAYKSLASKCADYNIHLAGHKALNITLEESILSGQRSFEHGRIFMFDCFPYADSLLLSEEKGKTFRNLMPSMIHEFDTAQAHALMELMRENNSYWVPTLQTLKMSAYADDEAYANNSDLAYIPGIRKSLFWKPDIGRAAQDNSSEERAGVNMAFYKAAKGQVKMAQDLGVPIMTGTDVTDTYVFPGFSIHTELKDLTEAGLSNLEALQAATIAPARFAKMQQDYGTIEPNKQADMILLSANPLEDISNTQKIEGVFFHGHYHNRETLEKFKESTKNLVSSFHLNVKFVWSFIASPLMRQQFAD